ncbi:MAG: NAD(P)/FAD-dependent oxidoreductase [Candidatus Eremiobacteraeota bacterium]|nr:NAD(P)/FAD-dependent oxidoreductase [Candidatus Eremiobacteraeota bacterium]MCW5870968.1 NAD(P)/FAD-dependent oxidoreductase [Candidatus Eremiobacteraeota bacterium]
MVKECSVLIVGGGPAGLTAARALLARGLRPVVLERRRWPVDKVCGEGIMPVGLASLRRLGVESPAGCPLRGVDYVEGKLRAGADFAEGPGLVVRRTDLSRALLCPAELVENCLVREVRRQGDWMEVDSSRGRWRCHLLVAADGLHSPIGLMLGLRRGGQNWLQRWGWRQHFAIKPWNGRVEVHYARDCEAYLSPVGPERLGVAVVSRTGLRRHNWLQAFPELQQRLHAPVSQLAGYGPLWQRSRRVHEPGVVLLGDAAGYLDACTGEGLSLAFAQAEALGELYREGPGLTFLPEYGRRYADIVRHYYTVTWGALWLARWPWLRTAVLRTLAGQPGLFQQLLSANQGLLPPHRPLLKLLLKVPPQLFAGWLGHWFPGVGEKTR